MFDREQCAGSPHQGDEADSGLLQVADRSILFLCRPGSDVSALSDALLAENTLVVPARDASELAALDFVPTQALVEDDLPGALEWMRRWTALDDAHVAIGLCNSLRCRELLAAGALLVLPRPIDIPSALGAVERVRRWRSLVRELSELRTRERSAVAVPVIEGLLSALGHEIRNPLAVALANVEYLRDSDAREIHPISFDERRSVIEDTHGALCRIRELLETVGTLVRGAPPETEPVPLLDVARRVVSLTPSGRASIRVIGDANVVGIANLHLLERVIAGLLLGALEATRALPAPEIALRVYRTESEARVTIRDNARALSPAERSEIFEPKLQVGGNGLSGLGLPLLRHAVTRMGGTLSLGGDQGVGRSFRVRLPAAPASGGTVQNAQRTNGKGSQ